MELTFFQSETHSLFYIMGTTNKEHISKQECFNDEQSIGGQAGGGWGGGTGLPCHH